MTPDRDPEGPGAVAALILGLPVAVALWSLVYVMVKAVFP